MKLYVVFYWPVISLATGLTVSITALFSSTQLATFSRLRQRRLGYGFLKVGSSYEKTEMRGSPASLFFRWLPLPATAL
jgi:hypothetical protein